MRNTDQPFEGIGVDGKKQAVETLREFLAFPLNRTDGIFRKFAELPGATCFGEGRRQVLFVPGSRPIDSGRCLLVAHADTVWDDWPAGETDGSEVHPVLVERNGVIRSGTRKHGIGADDRAGLAILWLLRGLGHSLMITDLEEVGRLGSKWLRDHEPSFLAQINRDHAFAVQFDRREARSFKCYDVGTRGFRRHVAQATGFSEPDRRAFTDICTLCSPSGPVMRMCGTNLSIGYYDEHTELERLVISEWLHSFEVTTRWLSTPRLPAFRQTRDERPERGQAMDAG